MINKTGTLFRQRLKYFLLGLASIVLGLLIYLIFRPNTYVSVLVKMFLRIDIPAELSNYNVPFLKYYFADYLWAFAFSCWLRCIPFNVRKRDAVCFLVVGVTGILYEIMQFFGVVSGTGDIYDCLLYLLAGWTVNILNKKKEFLV